MIYNNIVNPSLSAPVAVALAQATFGHRSFSAGDPRSP
jgi:hypothetical protein